MKKSSTTSEPTPEEVEAEIQALEAEIAACAASVHLLLMEQAQLAYHPHYDWYTAGGLALACGLVRNDIAALIGWFDERWPTTCADLRATDEGGRYLLKRLPHILDSDRVRLAAQGHALIRARGHLIDGVLPAQWLDDPKFGLGAAFAMLGFLAPARDAWAGLWTLSVDTLEHRCRRASRGDRNRSLGSLLLQIIEEDAARLTVRGARSTFLRAQAAYQEDCASFAVWEAEHPNHPWREKVARSRQGYLARSTARHRDLADPVLTGRGQAADWLETQGANVRFKEGKTS